MITHIVLFKLKDRSEETINRTAQVLRDLDGKIDELLFLDVGTDVLHSERSFDVALTATFQDMDGLQAYQVHPEHKKVIDYINTVKEVSISVDYES